ncbi:MAG: hypothetical protein JO281_12850 [Pseudonocardiales bacterium]|nr:hypothetical protein [Pseudonocardiales bacterium]
MLNSVTHPAVVVAVGMVSVGVGVDTAGLVGDDDPTGCSGCGVGTERTGPLLGEDVAVHGGRPNSGVEVDTGVGVGVGGSAEAEPMVRVRLARQAPAASSTLWGRIRVGIL